MKMPPIKDFYYLKLIDDEELHVMVTRLSVEKLQNYIIKFHTYYPEFVSFYADERGLGRDLKYKKLDDRRKNIISELLILYYLYTHLNIASPVIEEMYRIKHPSTVKRYIDYVRIVLKFLGLPVVNKLPHKYTSHYESSQIVYNMSQFKLIYPTLYKKLFE